MCETMAFMLQGSDTKKIWPLFVGGCQGFTLYNKLMDEGLSSFTFSRNAARNRNILGAQEALLKICEQGLCASSP